MKALSLIKYKIIRWIEKFPLASIIIYNNAKNLAFFLPHEKDYYGMLKVCKNSNKYSIIDVGANIGISTLGFRKLGFINPIYLFEPNSMIYFNYLKKIKKKYKNIFIKNVALDKKKGKKKLYLVYYKGKNIHHMSSFDKKYVINTIKITYSKFIKSLSILNKNVTCNKFDDLKLRYPPKFIKLDTEGNDYNILLGMKKSIKKYKPIFLIEYNVSIFKKIRKILKLYKPFVYDYINDKFLEIDRINKKRISRTSRKNFLTNRNIYFIPINKSLKKLHDNYRN